MVTERGQRPLKNALPYCWITEYPGRHGNIDPKPEKTKHFQKQLSETCANANFINPVRHRLHRFLSMKLFQKGRTGLYQVG